jgi:hypothetical protein
MITITGQNEVLFETLRKKLPSNYKKKLTYNNTGDLICYNLKDKELYFIITSFIKSKIGFIKITVIKDYLEFNNMVFTDSDSIVSFIKFSEIFDI